ncbi:MAG: tRNA (N6-isopentenyl adenosine(37)-C2)-methylthiotransferase MiaB [Clostridia bacterium]|nr:tRNA (N6-isopentenyl adenosine(37)-C2)-methylthiotransferase MiaB [Clostridia bacterium]
MKPKFVEQSVIEESYAAIERIRKRLNGAHPHYYIETYGCQMNEHDSEKIAGMLEGMGYIRTDDKITADFILFNTCCIREHAENRTFGNVGFLKELKSRNPALITAVCGCMMQQREVAKRLAARFPFVDMIFGTNELHLIPQMVEKVMDGGRVFEIKDSDGDIAEGLPIKRCEGFSTFVNIMYGCNNFCSYCIVPYVRGRERSRHAGDIIDEVRRVVEQEGFTEVTLLGQNVNSYNDNGMRFPELLRRVNEIDGLKRLRFMTSHPKDLSHELVMAMAECDKVCEHIHLPVQSGSNRILELMNRRYTREHYLELVDDLRKNVKGIELTTDIIVGFPTETEEDLEDTLSLVREVGYSAAYSFAYSVREGTKAAAMDGQIPEAVKKDRLMRLNSVIMESANGANDKYMGLEGEILIEGRDMRAEPMMFGKLPSLKMVYVKGDESMIGKYCKVRVTGTRFNSLAGEIID